ncbi:DUF2470 domain-containing protein [Actinopolymorpha sp. B17G11]|uniref:DUF2470 domain-containing protein n=1 Tax=Actinopolymorpha sp. B17G11 TaxID=3160861 RepID=UPI0032E4C7CE
MGATVTGRIEPTVPERTRSAVAAAASLTLSADGHRQVLLGLHALDGQGRVVLRLPIDCRVATDLAHGPSEGLRTVAEFTDLAPISVRDRVRAQVTFAGRLAPVPAREATDPIAARLDPELITFKENGGSVTVSPDEFASTETDLLAAHEADLLLHLADAHADLVAKLTRLIEPRLMHHVIRVLPLAMDRWGITLRLEYTRHHNDVRLPFPVRLTDVTQVGPQFRALLTRANLCPHRRRLHAER